MARPAQITQNNKFAKSLQYLMKEVRDEVDLLCRWASKFSIIWYYPFWWLWAGMPKVLKITIMQCLCNISRKSWVTNLMISVLIMMSVDSIIFDGFSQACPKYLGIFSTSQERSQEWSWDLTALAGSNATLIIYYTSNVLPPFILFLSQYGIPTESFLHLINCLCNIIVIFSSYSRSMQVDLFNEINISLKHWYPSFVSALLVFFSFEKRNVSIFPHQKLFSFFSLKVKWLFCTGKTQLLLWIKIVRWLNSVRFMCKTHCLECLGWTASKVPWQLLWRQEVIQLQTQS